MHGIPGVPEVQLIGHGVVTNHEGVEYAKLNHPTHKEFHKTVVSPEDEAKGYTRFYRWHIDAAFYDLSPPRVTSLYGSQVPKGIPQIVRYDDGSGDELPLTLGATAFASGHNMFDLLPAEFKSLAVRMKVKYAPHLYAWVNNTHAVSSGIAIENEGLEVPLGDLPAWEEEKRKVLSVVSFRFADMEGRLLNFIDTVLEERSHRQTPLPGPPQYCTRIAGRPPPSRCEAWRGSIPRWCPYHRSQDSERYLVQDPAPRDCIECECNCDAICLLADNRSPACLPPRLAQERSRSIPQSWFDARCDRSVDRR